MAKRNFTRDDNLQLKDAGLIRASAAAQVGGEARVLDLGAGLVEGNIVIDVTALELDDNDELYDIVVQLTNTAAFATDTDIVDRCSLTLAAAEVQRTDCNADGATGRYILPVDNDYKGTTYRYMRLYTVVAGTITNPGGINHVAYLCKRN
jgi:hypothetical protein